MAQGTTGQYRKPNWAPRQKCSAPKHLLSPELADEHAIRSLLENDSTCALHEIGIWFRRRQPVGMTEGELVQHDIPGDDRRLVARRYPDRRVAWCVARRKEDRDAGNDLCLFLHERIGDRRPRRGFSTWSTFSAFIPSSEPENQWSHSRWSSTCRALSNTGRRPGAGALREASDVIGVRVRERDDVDRLRRHVQLVKALAQATEWLVPSSELKPEPGVDRHRRVWGTDEHGVVRRGEVAIGVERARKSLPRHLKRNVREEEVRLGYRRAIGGRRRIGSSPTENEGPRMRASGPTLSPPRRGQHLTRRWKGGTPSMM